MGKLIRIAVYDIDEVLPYVFTGQMRHELIQKGYDHTSREWVAKSRRIYKTPKNGSISVTMGSHRYQLFAKKGVTCVFCGLEGKFFSLDKDIFHGKCHFNLYGTDANKDEVMLTKDHIIPRAKGGKNVMDNYQPLCIKCNSAKADKILC